MTDWVDDSSAPFRFFVPTEVVFGAGTLSELTSRCAALGSRPLVVTGKRSAHESGLLDRVLALFPGAGLFDDVEENPTTTTCERAAKQCRDEACDFVVALGGGSPMDVAKAAAGLALNPGLCADYFGADKFTNGALPIVAIPTTAGTGSEVTPGAVIVDADAGVKRTVSGRVVYPRLAILDPEVTLSLPRTITVNTGLDVLSQAMEGIVSKKAGPLTTLLGLEACRLVKRWLPAAADDGQDIEARSAMLYASLLSGCVIAQTGTTLVHGMGYYLTIEFGVAHGLANALLLTPLFQHNADHLPEVVAAIAGALGISAHPTAEEAGLKVANALHALLGELDVSPAAKDAGVELGPLRGFADHIVTDPYRFKNQVGDLPAEKVLALYEQAWEGAIR
ncbi:MAG: iron-containing alcohol dehydrogenase [bacterium]|nr:iron-containing alcohol dehydrogenase [bacterium]